MGKASITIAVNAKWNGNQLENAEKALRRLTTLSAASSKSTTADLAKQGGAWAELGGKIYNAGVKTEKVGKMLTTSVTVPLVAMGTYAGKTAIQFDTAMANVRKTTNMSNAEIEKLAQSAQNLSTKQPVTAETLLNIEALGAQLGVANGKLESFAQVVSGLDIATNMDFETAGKEMAQFANITQMSQDKFKNYGSTIVDLGNHLATTESDISSMALRLAGAGTAANFSQAEILGMSGAMSSLGIRAEAGGSAMTRIIQDISKNVAKGSDTVEEYARVAGMSADEFAAAWKSKPMEALEALVEGLRRTSDSGEDMNVTLEKLGINNIRNSDTMRRLAGAGDLLRNSVDRANTAWEQNTALQNEVDQRNESLASRLQVLKNKVDSIAISIGRPLVNAVISALEACDPLIQGVGDLADAFAKMDTGQQQFVLAMVGIAAAAGPVLTVFGKIEQGVGSAVTAIGKGAQDFAVWKDALNTTDGAQMRAYASADTLANKMGIAGNAAAKAAGGAENYVAAWQGYYQTSQRVVDLEGKYATAVTKSSTAADKAKAAVDKYKQAAKLAADADEEGKAAATEYADSLKTKADAAKRAAKASADNVKSIEDELTVTTKARDTYGKMVDEWSGSTKETAKVTKEIADASNKTKTSVLDSANALKKQADAAKQGNGALKTLGNGLKTAGTGIKNFAIGLATSVGPQLAFAAAATLIGTVIGHFVEEAAKAKEHADLMSNAMRSGSEIMGTAAGNAGKFADAIPQVTVNAQEAAQSLADLNDSVQETFTKVSTDSAMLDGYVNTITELGNHSNLSATEQFRLKDAIDGYNSICGTSYEVTDALNGKIKDGEGNLIESTQALKDNAAAWEQNAKAQAAAKVATEYLEQELKAQQKLADAKTELAQQEEFYQNRKSELIKKGWSEESAANAAMNEDYKKAKQNVSDLSDTYNSAAEKQAYFAAMAAAAAAGLSTDVQDAVGNIASALTKLDADSSNALTNAGINITDLSVKMQEAGVSSEQLNSISSENFASMVASCGGNIDTLIAAIQNYNNTKTEDKHSTASADGNVVDGKATNEVNKFKDADSKRKSNKTNHVAAGSAVNGEGARGANTFTQAVNKIPLSHKTHISASSDTSAISSFTSALSRIPRTVTTFVSQIISSKHNAAGGIRPHAAGGMMMRYHANGAIANRPGAGVPLDIVGEAGAEAIVPLTNRKYSRPFARTIAEQMKQTGGGVSTQVVNNYTLNIDGSTIRGNDRAKELIEALVGELV